MKHPLQVIIIVFCMHPKLQLRHFLVRFRFLTFYGKARVQGSCKEKQAVITNQLDLARMLMI